MPNCYVTISFYQKEGFDGYGERPKKTLIWQKIGSNFKLGIIHAQNTLAHYLREKHNIITSDEQLNIGKTKISGISGLSYYELCYNDYLMEVNEVQSQF
jgi:hypothetical protein